MISLALIAMLMISKNDPPGVHTLRITVSGSTGFTYGRPELVVRPHDGVTAINPGPRFAHTYHGHVDENLLPGNYDVCAWATDYKPACVVIKMPDHDAHITVTLATMPIQTEVPEAEPGLESNSK